MKEYTSDEMKKIYISRRKKLANYLADNNTGAAVFVDNEEHRDPSIPYYTGHSGDAVLVIFTDGYSVLIPWDENLANKIAYFDKLIPFTRYKNNDIEHCILKRMLNSVKRFSNPGTQNGY